ncbi:MAG: alpha amylase C-terminal domain-containing protein [Bacteroidota bacterium]
MIIPAFVQRDKYLMPFASDINRRLRNAFDKEKNLTKDTGSLSDFANGHKYYGLHKTDDSWIIREWAPNATQIYLLGNFNDWEQKDEFAFRSIGAGNWSLELPLESLKHLDLYKLYVKWGDGEGERIPAWARRVVQDEETYLFNAQVWDPAKKYKWKNPVPKADDDFVPFVYEAHTGMASEDYKVATWNEFRENILPYVHKAGYNVIQMMAVQEHPYYGSFGYHVSNFFAPSSRFGSADDLKALIDEAHGLGIRLVMDIVHSHAVKNEIEGISRYDGTYYQFFHDGPRGNHQAWDSRCFDYGKDEVIHFLLSNCKYWLEEFRFDGFRFDGVTSMLYHDHGLGTAFVSYEQYFDHNQDEDAISYLILANKLIHEVNPSAISIAEEMSGMPGIATPHSMGGIGFDYRLAMGIPDFWIKTIKEKRVEFWHVGDMFYNLSNKRADEKTIHYCESHDQALVGDKTIIFWLMDKDMYFDMSVDRPNINVDSGIALHKLIRLITLATAGNGYLNFMGNEFGHPEWIDFPGLHNNWSYHYARRQWSLKDNPDLKFKYLASFDKEMLSCIKKYNVLTNSDIFPHTQNIDDQVLTFSRNNLIFVFNFSPFRSYTDYLISVPKGSYKIVLNSDRNEYGGFERIDEEVNFKSESVGKGSKEHGIKLYIPAQTALVLRNMNA